MTAPTFLTAADRVQVEQLIQPALIRVIDNIRKQLDETNWQGTYEEDLVWPDGTTDEQKQTYANLQQGLHGVPPEEHDRVAAEMSKLPQPSPIYTLRLTKADMPEQTVDVWATCLKVCAASKGTVIEADAALLAEDGDVDWLSLDEKAKSLVEDIFQLLPGS